MSAREGNQSGAVATGPIAIEQVAIGLGGNLGDVPATMARALRALGNMPGVAVGAVSSLYQSPAWTPDGWTGDPQPDYRNAVALIATTLEPEALLALCLAIETANGRIRTTRYGPRTLDLDILVFGSRIIDTPSLRVPHPRLLERAFALIPLAEIAPRMAIPGWTNRVVADAASRLGQGGLVVTGAMPPSGTVLAD